MILDKEIGPIGYGLMGLTWRPPHLLPSTQQAFAAMSAALASGANFWNGGEIYGPPSRNSLHLLAEYFDKYPEAADKVLLSIKGGFVPGTHQPDGSAAGVRRSVDECNRILGGRKKVDIWECARVDPNTPIEDTVKALAELVKEGLIGGIGLSEVKASTIRRAAKIHPIAAVEVELSVWATDILQWRRGSVCRARHPDRGVQSPFARDADGGGAEAECGLAGEPEGLSEVSGRRFAGEYEVDGGSGEVGEAEGRHSGTNGDCVGEGHEWKGWVGGDCADSRGDYGGEGAGEYQGRSVDGGGDAGD